MTKDAEGCNTFLKEYLNDQTYTIGKRTPETEEEKN